MNDNLDDFKRALGSALTQLDTNRRKHLRVINKFRKIHYVTATVAIGLVIIYFVHSLPLPLNVALLLLAFASAAVEVYKIQEEIETYKSYYKDNIVRVFLKQMSPDALYVPKNFPSEEALNASKLFGPLSFFKGEDGFKGTTKEGYPFQFFEIELDSKSKSDKEKGLKDLFMTIENPNMNVQQIVLTSSIQDQRLSDLMLNKIGSFFNYAHLQTINLKASGFDPEFAQNYTVYSQEADEVVQLLIPEFCQLMNRLTQKLEMPLRMSFVGNTMSLVILSQSDFFEIDIKQPVVFNKVAQTLHQELRFCFDLVDKMSQYFSTMPNTKNLESDDKSNNPNWNNSAYDHLIDNDD